MIPLHALAVGLLGLLLGLAAILVLAAASAVVGLLFGRVIDEAFAPLTSDDEPRECTDPACDCEQARALLRRHLRWQRSHWTERDDQAVADYARSIGGA